jgi:hypothetical protein
MKRHDPRGKPVAGALVLLLTLFCAATTAWGDGPGAGPGHSVLGMRGPGAAAVPRPLLAPLPATDYRAILRDRPTGGGTAIFGGLLSFYRNVISPVDGDRCDMAPTCSLYSHQALQSHGVLLGVPLTADRLLHEADERPLVVPLTQDGERFYPDPLRNNTWWLPAWLR